MFIYDTKLPIQVQITRPDPRYYLLLDRQLGGCQEGLRQAMVYTRQAFMIHNPKFQELFLRMAARRMNDMEILAVLLHQMHGEDDRYYDESNDDTPVFELLRPSSVRMEEKEEEHQEQQYHHVNDDLTAAVLRDIAYEEENRNRYEQLIQYVEDDGADRVFSYLKESGEKVLETLRNILKILTTHTEMKDFGEGDTHDAWDLDTSNYFDKPNPYFLNPDDLNDFPME